MGSMKQGGSPGLPSSVMMKTLTQPAACQVLSAFKEKQVARFRGHNNPELLVTWFLPGHTVECLEEISECTDLSF